MDPVLVLSAMRIIRAPEVAGVSAVICRSIERDAAKHGLVVTGPWIFVSDHIAKSIDDRFKIEFCLPVAASESYSGSFKLKTLSAITAASTVHNGPLDDHFVDRYGPLIAAESRYLGECREIYYRWVNPQSRENQVELLFALK